MPLDTANLKIGIKTLLTDMQSRETDSIDEYAERLSQLMEDFVKSAQINYTSGLTNSGGPVTGAFVGNIT